jgi:hypothetical protein
VRDGRRIETPGQNSDLTRAFGSFAVELQALV